MDVINSKETEMSVIGSILYQPDMFTRVYSAVKAEDFYYPVYRYVFGVMFKLHGDGLDINVKTVWNELYKRGYSDTTEEELYSLLDYRVSTEVALSFASQIADFSGYRILQSEVSSLLPSIKERERSLLDYASEFSNLAKRVSSKGVKQSFGTGDALASAYFEMLSRPQGTISFTGIKRIDENLVDLAPKEITIVAARPGVGKTAILLQSVRLNLEAGLKVGFLSMEMSQGKLMNRLISSRTRINGTSIGKLSPESFSKDSTLVGALKWFTESSLVIDDTGPFTSDTVPQKIRTLIYEYNCDVIYVDYIGLIRASGHLLKANRNEQLSEISGILKSLATELNIPIVVAAQLNRESTKTVTGRPNIAHLRDSGSLEQDASIIIMLYPDVEKMLMGGMSQGDVEDFMENQTKVNVKFEVAKQRNGSTFVEDLLFEKQYGVFVELAERNRTY